MLITFNGCLYVVVYESSLFVVWYLPSSVGVCVCVYICVCACVCVCTWSVCAGLLGVEFGFQGSSWLQFGFGELRQVRHHRLFVHTGIDDLLWSDHLHEHTHTHTESSGVCRKLYLNIPKSRFGLPMKDDKCRIVFCQSFCLTVCPVIFISVVDVILEDAVYKRVKPFKGYTAVTRSLLGMGLKMLCHYYPS